MTGPTPIPLTLGELTTEIARFTDLPPVEVERMVWTEALEGGSTVARDLPRFGVTPHRYDAGMERLYRESLGFIVETLVFWAKPSRQRWTTQALERVARYAASKGLRADQLQILMLGDGSGNDSICFANAGYRVDYFDVPGSRTFDFALRRFEHHGLLDARIKLRTDYATCLGRGYDVVVSFEVLEHLPDPVGAIRDMRAMLKPGGIALVTEAFGSIRPDLPTHLLANARYEGATPLLFLREGLQLGWYNRAPLFKPFEFVAVDRPPPRAYVRLASDQMLLSRWCAPRVRRLERRLGRALRVLRPAPAGRRLSSAEVS